VTVALSADAARTAGVLLVTLVAVAFGGTFLLRVVRGSEPATPFQTSFFRAGHAHAGVLVLLSLVAQLYVDAAGLDGAWRRVAAQGVPLAAILMPAGFFLSAAGRGRERPNRLVVLVWLGAASLVAGVTALGVGLLTSV
jgi:cytochrome b561